MKLWLAQVVLQLFLALGLSPFVSGFIRKLKAVLQNRRGPSLWQPYHDLFKWVRKGTVVSQQASWLFRATPYVSFLTALMVSLMVPMVTAVVPLSYFGGVLAVVYLLFRARRPRVDELAEARRLAHADAVAIYWHFMDGLWIYLFLLLFLWRSQ